MALSKLRCCGCYYLITGGWQLHKAAETTAHHTRLGRNGGGSEATVS
jgi:hypothetical protein